MAKNITTVEQVKAWFEELKADGELAFHPDSDFKDYVQPDGQDAYTLNACAQNNALLEQCFDVCEPHGKDYIYQLAMEVFDPMEAVHINKVIDIDRIHFDDIFLSCLQGCETYRDQVLKEDIYGIDSLIEDIDEENPNTILDDFLKRIKRLCDKHEAAYFRIITP